MGYNYVYLGLGGNIGDTRAILLSILEDIKALPGVKDVELSSFYQTAPVSSISQNDFINAVCRLKTTQEAQLLLRQIQDIEVKHGKVPKHRDEPRKADIDILFYGDAVIDTSDLQVPHPRWKDRLFVLVPLFDLAPIIPGLGGKASIDIKSLINAFPIAERQQIKKLEERSLHATHTC